MFQFSFVIDGDGRLISKGKYTGNRRIGIWHFYPEVCVTNFPTFELSLIQSLHPFNGMIVRNILWKHRFHNTETYFYEKLPWYLSFIKKNGISFIIVIIQSRNSIYGVYSNTFYKNRVDALGKWRSSLFFFLSFLHFIYFVLFCRMFLGGYEMGVLIRNELRSVNSFETNLTF